MPLAASDFTLLHGLHVKAMSLGAQAHPLGAVQDASQVPNADPLMLPRGEILASHGFAWRLWLQALGTSELALAVIHAAGM